MGTLSEVLLRIVSKLQANSFSFQQNNHKHFIMGFRHCQVQEVLKTFALFQPANQKFRRLFPLKTLAHFSKHCRIQCQWLPEGCFGGAVGCWRGEGGETPRQGNRTLAPPSRAVLTPASCPLPSTLLLLLSWARRMLVGCCCC